MTDQTWFTTAEVEAARQRLADNRYGGPSDLHDLDAEAIHEIVRLVLTATWQSAVAEGRRQAADAARGLTRCWWWPGLADARQDFERLIGPWEAEQTPPVDHARGCACGWNDAGQRFDDPICRRR